MQIIVFVGKPEIIAMKRGEYVGFKVVNRDTGARERPRARNWGRVDIANAKYRIRSLRCCLADADNSTKL